MDALQPGHGERHPDPLGLAGGVEHDEGRQRDLHAAQLASFGNGESGTSPCVTITVAHQTFLLEQHPMDAAFASGHRLHVDTASMSRIGEKRRRS